MTDEYCKKPINLICRETLPSIIQGTLNPLRYGTYGYPLKAGQLVNAMG